MGRIGNEFRDLSGFQLLQLSSLHLYVYTVTFLCLCLNPSFSVDRLSFHQSFLEMDAEGE